VRVLTPTQFYDLLYSLIIYHIAFSEISSVMARRPVAIPVSPSPRSVSSAQKRPRSVSSEQEDSPLTDARCREIVADELKRFKADLGEFMNYLVDDKIIV
jgi:hypothetical protein